MSPSLSAVLLVVGGLLHCGLPSATAVRANYTELFSSFDIKQHIAIHYKANHVYKKGTLTNACLLAFYTYFSIIARVIVQYILCLVR